ncbi:tRNA lysidine(34) synthetase TilS [Pasteurella langaaensis]|nr:tRNA lysidine(34) synthetase TilS [Pasteurella langaaensis]
MSLLTEFQSKLKHQKYLIAFSGGLDSTALLSLFAKSRENRPHLQLRAIHIHHGLSPNADKWQQHCEQICAQLNIPLITKKVHINKKNGIEQGAREARYQGILETRLADEIVATAHHLQDQTETFFLALKRGSGVKGLGAMQTESELFAMPIFRPLLNYTKDELETFVRAENLTWVEDESNGDSRYDRNFLRNQVLPLLRQRWAHFDDMVTMAAQHCYNQQQLVNELLNDEFKQNYDETDRTFNISKFEQYSVHKQYALLRMWLAELGLPMLGELPLSIIVQNVILAKSDANPQYQLQGKMIRRYQHKLYLTPQFADVSHFQAELKIGEPLLLPDGLGTLELLKTSQNLTALWHYRDENCAQEFRSHLPFTEEKIRVGFGYSGKVKVKEQDLNREIKKVWQKLNVPTWQRNRIPLIFYGNTLKSAVGFFKNFGE